MMTKNPPPEFWRAIKLVHSEDLRRWDRFPKYQQHHALNYEDYRREANRILELKRRFPAAVQTWKRLLDLDCNEFVRYDAFDVDIGPALRCGTKRVALRKPAHEHTVVTASDGTVENGVLFVSAGWRKKRVSITYSCPSRHYHAQEIKLLRATLSAMNETECRALQEIKDSRFTHPVLFVSHRWETPKHPDPNSVHLKKLRELENCFIFYDYTSIPQEPMCGTEAKNLDVILQFMGELVRDVIVLNSPDYTTRGWCVYEYIVSSLLGSVVCDEIREPAFVSLRNWASTPVPVPPVRFAFRDSKESMQQNYINEAILSAVNDILPRYGNAIFSVDKDRAIVDKLLVAHLKAELPPKKNHIQYQGEWKTISWKDEELADAFSRKLQWEPQQKGEIEQHRMNVPKTVGEAVRSGYKIDVPPFRPFGL